MRSERETSVYGGRIGRRALLRQGGIAAAGLTAVGLVGCGVRQNAATTGASSSGASAKPKTGGKVAVNVTTDPFDWDLSYVGKSIPNGNGQSLAYEGLMHFKYGADIKYGDLQVGPKLAEKWESPDAQSFTFHLRPGVKFANLAPVNGRALTSDDVKWTYEYWSRTGNFTSLPLAQFAWFFEGMDSIQTPDPQSVVVKFKTPFAPFLSYAAAEYNPIVPHEIYDQYGNFHDHIVGSGPWQLDVNASQKGSRWVWKRNQSYWDAGKPYIDEIDWLVITDASTAINAFNTKQLDWIGRTDSVSPQQAVDLKKANPTATAYQYPSSVPMHLYMNTRVAPLTDARVRQAISYAMDRDELVKIVDLGQGNWALAGALPDTFTQSEIKQMLGTDIQKSKQLLSAAGYPNGIDLEFIVTAAYGEGYLSEAQLLQAQLKKAGINLNLKSIDKDAYSSNKKAGKYVITMTSKDVEGDVDSYLFATFHGGSKDNYAGVQDPKLDQMLEAQRREPDAAKRLDLVRQAVRYINVDQAYGLALETGTGYEFSRNLQNYAPQFGIRQTPEVDSWLDR
jgi:peptide/nickel transport system substrate-binding protein